MLHIEHLLPYTMQDLELGQGLNSNSHAILCIGLITLEDNLGMVLHKGRMLLHTHTEVVTCHLEDINTYSN